MKTERSAGAVIYSPKRNAFLLLQHRQKHFEFPKGKLERGEDDLAAMRREIPEETGIVDFEQIPFVEIVSYVYGPSIHKDVAYFLLLSDAEVEISKEHLSYKWFVYEEAIRNLKFDNHKHVLHKAHDVLMKFQAREKLSNQN